MLNCIPMGDWLLKLVEIVTQPNWPAAMALTAIVLWRLFFIIQQAAVARLINRIDLGEISVSRTSQFQIHATTPPHPDPSFQNPHPYKPTPFHPHSRSHSSNNRQSSEQPDVVPWQTSKTPQSRLVDDSQ